MNLSDEDDPRLGEIVAGRYRILMKIGRGGMGSVYEAEHVTTLKRFAIKVLLPGLGRVPEIARRFEREARASSVLNHPNIVNVVDFGTLDDDATLYLVMEYVPGRSLGDVIDAGRIPALRGIAICRQVLEALSHAHTHGVVHRDLKPDNIMLLDAGRSEEERDIVKLLDFGIAKVDDKDGEKLTQAGVAFGTPDYMAPEQALGEEVDARADLYALGVIVYEIFSGRRPFESGDKLAVLRMHVALTAPVLVLDAFGRAYVPELVQLCAKALEKRREDRYPSAAAMMEALDIATMAQAALEMKEPSAHLLRVSMARPAAVSPLPSVVPGLSRSEPGLQLDFDAPYRQIRRPDPAPTPSPASAPARRRAWMWGAAVVAAAAAGLAWYATSRPPAGTTTSPNPMLAVSRPKSERAAQAEKKLAAGDATGALAVLEQHMEAGSQLEVDPWSQLYLGHARFQLDRDADALAAYQTALSIAPDLGADVSLRVNLAAMVARKDRPKFALQALELAYVRLGPLGHALVIEHASRGKTPAVRKRAREMAEERGLTADVDWVGSYSSDLAQGATCKDRREAIPKLRALRDKRALPALKKARDRRGGFLNLADVNDCLDRDAQEAIDFLQALP